MPVTASAYEACVSTTLVDMAAACAVWTFGRGQIAEDWGDEDARAVDGTELDLAKTWLITRTSGVIETPIAWGTVTRSGDAALIVHGRGSGGDFPADAVRRQKNLAGDLADQMRAQLGTPGALVHAVFEVGPTFVTEPGDPANADGDRPRELETEITVHWSELP